MPTHAHQQGEVYEKWDVGGWVKAIFDETELELCRRDPVVVTFGGYPKPWLGGHTDHPMYQEWVAAYRSSGWHDVPVGRLSRVHKVRRRVRRAAKVLVHGTYTPDHAGW
jgi:hypothetical protein